MAMKDPIYFACKTAAEVCEIINKNCVLPVYRTNGKIPYSYGTQVVSPIMKGLISYEVSIEHIIHEKCGISLLFRKEILKGELLAGASKLIMNKFFGKNICHVKIGDYLYSELFKRINFTFEVQYQK